MRPDERDLDDELRGHLALSIRERVAGGEDPDAARLAALAELGYPPDVRDSMRRVWYSRWYEAVDGVRRDARFALRVLRKSPGFLLVAVVTLALAIGANAVVFGVLNGLILRPLNVPNPESLYGIEHAAQHNMYESYPDYRDLRDRNHSFESLAGFTIVQTGFDTGDDSSRVWVVQATGNYFDALGVQPYLGRVFHASDERGPNSAPYLVLGYGFWRSHFNADPSVVGRIVRVNTHPFTIIGVAPEWFHGTLAIANADVYAPFVQDEQLEGRNRLEARASTAVFMALGHLKPGVTPEQAVDDLNGIGRYLETTYPSEHGATTFRLARPGLYGSYLGEPLRAFVAGLLVLSGLILLGACANLGSLFAARAADRSREIAVRLSLGASRGRILRQLMTEAVIIALAGGSVGLWGSVVLLRSLASWQPMPKFPMVVPVAPDGRVYALAVGLALLSGLLFGLVPARQVFRTDPYQVIKAGPSAMIGRRLTVRDLLLVAQVAICAVLVTASIVAVRGLGRAVHAPYGFDPRDVLLAETDLSMAGYSGGRIPDAQQQMIDRLATLPGVAGVAAIGRPPLSAGGFTVMVFHEDAAELSPQKSIATAVRYVVSPAYFQVARTSLIAGRPFSSHDDASAPRVAILNRELARRTFGAPDAAVGRRLKLRDGEHVEVVGIAENGKYATLTEEILPAIFLPLRQTPNAETWMLVRGAGDAEALAGPVRAALRAYDPRLPIYLETWDRNLDFALFAPRMATVALGVMGVIAAMLAVTGVFGMASYSVSKRMRELGIRIALGAQRKELLSAAVGRALKLLACGSIAGVALGGLASRLLAAIVYQATSRDPLVLSGVIGVMFSFGLLATWIPARRALSADPLRLLRQD